jgi:hypothetical protein
MGNVQNQGSGLSIDLLIFKPVKPHKAHFDKLSVRMRTHKDAIFISYFKKKRKTHQLKTDTVSYGETILDFYVRLSTLLIVFNHIRHRSSHNTNLNVHYLQLIDFCCYKNLLDYFMLV